MSLADKFTMGWELESTGDREEDDELPKGVAAGSDGSVNGAGLEYRLCERYVMDPSLGIRILRDLLKTPYIDTDHSCGFHVHIGLKEENLANSRLWSSWLVTLAKNVEDMAFEAVPPSRKKSDYCRKWGGVMVPQGIMKQSYNASKGQNEHRYQWLNITEMFRPEGIRTAEFRLMGDTHKFSLLYAWVAVCMKMGESALLLITDPSLLDVETERIRSAFYRVKRIRLAGDLVSMKDALALGQEVGLSLSDAPIVPPVLTTATERSIVRRAILAAADYEENF